MRLILVGATGITRDLLRGLGEMWDVAVIDPDPERLALAAKLRVIDQVVGDFSSAETLDRAHLSSADAVVAATNDDGTNLAVCELALSSGIDAVAAVAADPERTDDYRDLGVGVVSADRLASRRIEIVLEPRRTASAALAEGLAEAIEFRIAGDSPLRGKALNELQAEEWLVAAVLRDDRLIVPHGETVLQRGDLVTVVGAAVDRTLMVETFTSGEARFPLDYGQRVLVAIENDADVAGPLAEAAHLVRNSHAAGISVVIRESTADDELLEGVEGVVQGIDMDLVPVPGPAAKTLLGIAGLEDAGVIVVPAPSGGAVLGRMGSARVLRSIHNVGVPVLLSRSSHPYRRVAVLAEETESARAAGRAAIDLAAFGGVPLIGAAVFLPSFMAGPEERERVVRAAERLREESAVQGVVVNRQVEEGNPVRVMADLTGSDGLLVAPSPERVPNLVALSDVGHMVQRARSSVMIVPAIG